MPICKTCKIDKPETEFHTTGKNRTLKKECKVCINIKRQQRRKANSDECKAQDKIRYQKDREKRLRQVAKYRQEHLEVIKQHKKSYRERNKEKLSQQHKKYYEANKEHLREQAKKYYEANKGSLKEQKSKYLQTAKGRLAIKNGRSAYKARKYGTSDSSISLEALAHLEQVQNSTCFYCKTPIVSSEPTTHLDHFIPLSLGGTHSISNVVWSCATCNLKKNNNLPTKEQQHDFDLLQRSRCSNGS